MTAKRYVTKRDLLTNYGISIIKAKPELEIFINKFRFQRELIHYEICI